MGISNGDGDSDTPTVIQWGVNGNNTLEYSIGISQWVLQREIFLPYRGSLTPTETQRVE